MFDDIIENKTYHCIGCDEEIPYGEVCETCNQGGKVPDDGKYALEKE